MKDRTLSILTASRMVRRFRHGVMNNRLYFVMLIEIVLAFCAQNKLLQKASPTYNMAIKV